MSSTTFVDFSQNTPIGAAWLNDVNANTYTPQNVRKTANNSAAAWVRFVGSSGLVQQSVNVATVVRISAGIYTITFSNPMTNTANCYSLSMSQAGFIFVSGESAATVTISVTDASNNPVDPAFVGVVVFGAN